MGPVGGPGHDRRRVRICSWRRDLAAVIAVGEVDGKEGVMAREVLKGARSAAGMTQQQVADHLGTGLRYYQDIESGKVIGGVWIWDALEDLFGVHQRTLRQTSDTRLDPTDSP